MKQVAFVTQDEGSDSKMDETIGVPDGTDPKECIDKLLKEFNAEEDRRHEENNAYESLHRKLISIKGNTGKQDYYLGTCEFGEKLNNVTILFQGGSFDVYRCNSCKLLMQRETFEMPDRSCYPELCCVKCNKQFKNKAAHTRHMKIGKHPLPPWIDFARNLANLGMIY